jgi:protein-S-isoprenylcysteine O-methyltransferase Ste14
MKLTTSPLRALLSLALGTAVTVLIEVIIGVLAVGIHNRGSGEHDPSDVDYGFGMLVAFISIPAFFFLAPLLSYFWWCLLRKKASREIKPRLNA